MNLSLFLMSMFLTISLEAAAAFISAKARLSFRVVMSKPRALSKLSFRSRLLLRDISVFCLMSLDMWDTEDIGDTDDVFYTCGQGARGHTAVPDDCQYTTETLTVFCASHWQHSLAGAGGCECYVTRGHTDRSEGLSQSLWQHWQRSAFSWGTREFHRRVVADHERVIPRINWSWWSQKSLQTEH